VAVQAGRAELPVVPTLHKQFSRDLVQQMAGPARRAATTTGRDAGRQFGRTFERAGDDGARRFGVRFNKRLGGGFSASTKLATVAAGAIGGAFAAVQIGGFLKGAIDEAREAAKVGRQTAAVIKATGGIAKVSARDVDKLADRLSALVGVDDEVIATGANMLLTFKNVRNEVGKGNNIFDQASVAALDMTAAMGKGVITQEGLQSSTIRLGKALNDPLKGMTALTRVGVTFTEGQKKQVKALVEAGDTMGAQKIILRELSSEFGGAAKAAADPWQRVGVVMGNVKEDIGTLLLPAISSAATFIANKLVPGVKGFAEKHGPAFGRAFNNVRDAIANMITKARAWWKDHGPAVKDAFGDAQEAVFGVRGELDKIKKSWNDNSAAIKGVTGSVKEMTSTTGLPSLATLFRQTGEEIRFVITAVGLAARAFKIMGDVAKVGAKVQVAAVAFIADAIRGFVNLVLTGNRKIIAGAATVAEALHLPMAAGLRKAEQRMGGFQASMNEDFNRIMGKSRDAAANVPGGSRSRFGQSLRSAETQARRFRQSFNESIGNLRGKRITIPIKGTFQPPSGKFGSLHAIVGATGGYVTPRAIVHRADGGPIRMGTGPTADDVPAMLSKGEYVINAKATRKHRGLVEAINRDGLAGFARGGQVDVDVLTPKMGRFAGRIQRIIDTIGSRTAALLERRLRIFVGGVGKAAVTRFIRSADRLPYIWGGAGPGGYDCSGLVGAVHLAHQGRPYGHGQRIYTTSSIRAGTAGLKPGLGGVLDIGVTSGTGHMAGRYGGKRGLGFEAESTRTGIKIGPAASSPESFARHFHLARGGEVVAQKLDALARAGILDVGGDAGKLRINGQTFDRGGTLSPGLNLLANRTGRPEPLVPASKQAPIVVNVTVNGAVGNPREIARVLAPTIRQEIKEAQRRSGVPPREQVR
jgi:hypothetical protein